MPFRLSYAVTALTILLGACGSSNEDHTQSKRAQLGADETDASLCARFCERLPDTCEAAVVELKGADCNQSCLTPDSSTDFRRCMANASTCDELRVCKATH